MLLSVGRFDIKLCGPAAGGGGSPAHHARHHGRECSLHAAHRSARQPSYQARQALPTSGTYSTQPCSQTIVNVDPH